jgi:hypothetical protein
MMMNQFKRPPAELAEPAGAGELSKSSSSAAHQGGDNARDAATPRKRSGNFKTGLAAVFSQYGLTLPLEPLVASTLEQQAEDAVCLNFLFDNGDLLPVKLSREAVKVLVDELTPLANEPGAEKGA